MSSEEEPCDIRARLILNKFDQNPKIRGVIMRQQKLKALMLKNFLQFFMLPVGTMTFLFLLPEMFNSSAGIVTILTVVIFLMFNIWLAFTSNLRVLARTFKVILLPVIALMSWLLIIDRGLAALAALFLIFGTTTAITNLIRCYVAGYSALEISEVYGNMPEGSLQRTRQ